MTTNIVFDHRGRTAPGEEGPVEIRVTNDRKHVYVNTGISVRKSEFQDGEIVNRYDADGLNALLKSYVNKVLYSVARLVAEGRPIKGPALRRMLGEPVGGERDALDWLMQQVGSLNVSKGTLRHYHSLVKRLEEFGGILRWSDVTPGNICSFDTWLHERVCRTSDAGRRGGAAERKIGDASVYNYHKNLKALLGRAVLFDKIPSNPYDRLRGKFKRGDRETVDFLTKKEAEAVMAVHPEPGTQMAAARDLFVFQMSTGMSYGDTQKFDFDDYKEVRGRWTNIGERIKTGVTYISRLSDECMEILRRYGMTLPKLDNSTYNICLKAIGVIAGLKKPLHSHVARHTFATLMLARGAKLENVSRMLGHTNVTQTMRYAKILPQSIIDDYDNRLDEED